MIWKPIPNFEGYAISTMGMVKSLAREVRNPRYGVQRLPERVMCGGTIDGYRSIGLRRGGRSYTFLIHRLVLETFVGPCPEGLEGCHKNGNKQDCRVENLRWGTRLSNAADKKLHGTEADTRGSKNGRAMLTEAKVLEIRSRRNEHRGRLAEEFGIKRENVNKIIYRRTWKHV